MRLADTAHECDPMTTHIYTEDQLIEQPAVGLLAELGWSTVSALRWKESEYA